jgi:hypothetical protein
MQTKLSILFFVLCWITDKPCWNASIGSYAYYYDKNLKTKIYTSVEVEPDFPGGAPAYQRFLNKNLRYPQDQIDLNDLQSTAIMKFIVTTDGKIRNITINSNDSTQMTPFEKEVFRIIKLMPLWTPGICKGKAVTATVKRTLMIHLEAEE